MSNRAISALLAKHSIRTRESAGRLFAEALFTVRGRAGLLVEWEDVTGWNQADLLAWLGY